MLEQICCGLKVEHFFPKEGSPIWFLEDENRDHLKATLDLNVKHFVYVDEVMLVSPSRSSFIPLLEKIIMCAQLLRAIPTPLYKLITDALQFEY